MCVALLASASNAALASAAGGVLFAYPAGGASSPADCPKTTETAQQCTLAQALGLVTAGETVKLAAAGPYVGSFNLATAGTTAGAQVTIEPASGVTGPVLDGGGNGTVLTVAAGLNAVIKGVEIEGGEPNPNATSFGCVIYQVLTGGGILNHGTLKVKDDTFSDNNVDNTLGESNGDLGELGGAIYNDGTLTVTGSKFTGNGVAGAAGQGSDFVNAGGAIFNGGQLSVTDSTFSGNTADDNGGAISNEEIPCNGGVLVGPGTATITGSTFTSNYANYGGAVDNGRLGPSTMTVRGATFTDNGFQDAGYNLSQAGGGLYSNGQLTVSGSLFSGNVSGQGAAVYSGGGLSVTASSFGGNGQVDQGENTTMGGGIDVAGGTLSAAEDTFSGNDANSGGGIYVAGGGSATVTSSTFDNNDFGGVNGGAGTTLAADILANGACAAAVTDGGYNVADGGGCAFTASTSVNSSSAISAYLGSYGEHGGPLPTIPLQRDPITAGAGANPALDSIPGTFVAPGASTPVCAGTDARGEARPSPCSAGSFEPSPTGLVLYAYPTGGAAGGPLRCRRTSDPARRCTLAQALAVANGGDRVDLAVSGVATDPSTIYAGNWTVDADSSQTQQLSIGPARGVSKPILDGQDNGHTTLQFDPGSWVDLKRLVLQNGTCRDLSYCGGAITTYPNVNLTVDSVTFSGNAGESAAAIGGSELYAGQQPGSLTVNHSTFTANTAFFTPTIAILTTLSVRDSTFNDPGPEAVYAGQSLTSVSDSTFIDQGGYFGNISDSTFVGTSTNPVDQPDIYATSLISSTIFDAVPLGPVMSGDLVIGAATQASGGAWCQSITDDGYNIEDNDSCGFTAPTSVNNSTSIDGYLGPLARNGGPTETIALLATSTVPGAGPDPALHAIPGRADVPGTSTPMCSVPDQRGEPRTAPCDIGAFERQRR